MNDGAQNPVPGPVGSFGRWASWLDMAGKAAMLLGFVATFALNDKGGLLVFGLVLFFLLKAVSVWLLTRSYPMESRERRRALVEAWVWTIILVGLVGGPVLLMSFL